ncbi:MAG: DSBA oxidoreductase [Candidatus Moranbacteria bacterium GW2011_GWE1_36_7]|nr:MAG: DSBA oxidoreductase [Candidatus Moranbacteria bacterium GW2011_GWD2_36_12]KKQ06828.1 MAG: DSBA oxidoreductase [Candidatus Moranbacteria bacterium GW2011_GWE2_36_40]KKQ15418.1 MAG: DSBA oxidoreductase [Candidatus Moranbacteria bacterium GW2011_GWE1_36_7]
MEDEKKDQATDEQYVQLGEIQEEVEETEEEKKDKKIKNLISAIILLAGLFVGSLFVDVAQMVRGGGFSERALKSTDVFSSGGKTWVAYSEPLVKVQVISDDTCEACKPDEVLIGLKQALPTISNEKIDFNSEKGKKIIAQFEIKTIPAFIFSKEIEKTELFAKAQPFLNKQGESYAIKSAEAGFPVGKYIVAPQISEKDITIGSSESTVKVVAFSNFQSPSDKKAYAEIITPMLKEYGDKVQLDFKSYVPPTATQGTGAALAAACANEQGKFVDYAGKLFASQDAWGKAKDATPIFKGYAATIGLKLADFNKCLDDKKYQDQITANVAEGQSFGLQATPSIFIGTDLQLPTAKYDDMKKVIDEQLAK